MAYYNESVYDTGNTFFEFWDGANIVSGGLFYGLIIVGGMFFITFLISKQKGYQNNVTFVASSFVSLFTSLILWLLSSGGYYSDIYLTITFILFIVSVLTYKLFEE